MGEAIAAYRGTFQPPAAARDCGLRSLLRRSSGWSSEAVINPLLPPLWLLISPNCHVWNFVTVNESQSMQKRRSDSSALSATWCFTWQKLSARTGTVFVQSSAVCVPVALRWTLTAHDAIDIVSWRANIRDVCHYFTSCEFLCSSRLPSSRSERCGQAGTFAPVLNFLCSLKYPAVCVTHFCWSSLYNQLEPCRSEAALPSLLTLAATIVLPGDGGELELNRSFITLHDTVG